MIFTGKTLKSLRIDAGMSQQEVARLAGISQAHVAKIESEKVDPRLSTVNKIISILKDTKTSRKCGDVMTKNMVSAKPDEPVEKIVRLMRSLNISQIPVFQGKQQVGSIRESTIMRNIDRKLSALRARHIIDKPFPVVDSEDNMEILPPLLDFHPAVLVSHKGKVSGIITKSDLIGINNITGRR